MALSRVVEALEAHGFTSRNGRDFHCPGHPDDTPSLSVDQGEVGAVIFCHALCPTATILDRIGLSEPDLFDEPRRQKKNNGGIRMPTPQSVATYAYVDRHGELLARKVRWEPGFDGRTKSFTWEAPEAGGWQKSADGKGNPRVLYDLPAVVEADTVILNEGEKACEALGPKLPPGWAATCLPAFSAKTVREDWFREELRGKRVIVVVDRDATGEKWARAIASALQGVASEVRLVQSKTTGEHDDAADHVAAGHGLDDFVPWVETAAEAEVNDGWPPEPGPLPSASEPVPPMPADLVPEPLRRWVADAAERVSVPIEFIAASAVVTVGAVVGRSVGILPKRQDDWLVVPNLWGAVVGPPGVMKTAAIAESTRPLRALAARAHEEFEDRSVAMEAHTDVLKMQVEQVKRLAQRKAFDIQGTETKLKELKEQLRAATVVERRYLTHDSTVEKLGELLRDNPRGLLLLRDELAGFFSTLDRVGREGEREFFLEAWNGTGSFTTDRIGRGTVHITSVCISLLGAIQPSKLAVYLDGALAHEAQDDGLIQRVQLLVWPDEIGEWRNVDRWPDSEARTRALGIFERLDRLNPDAIGAVTPEHGELPALHFAADAQGLFDEWRVDLERDLRSRALAAAPSYAAHLAKYRSLLPSLALLFDLLVRVEGRGATDGVSLAATTLALGWFDLLKCHARKLYAAELNPGSLAAHLLAEKIQAGAVRDGDSIRDLGRSEWSGLAGSERIRSAAQELERAGWLRIESEKGPRGGRPSEVLRLHPTLRAEP